MAGLAQEALEPALRALEIRQMLAGNESEERLNELSDSLDTAGTILFSLGQNQQALQLLVASADIHYRFLDSNPLLHYQCLAETYNKIGPLYDSIGQSEKGLQACEIATSILRQLTEQDAVYEISLSIALNNLGNRYNNRGDRLKALEASTEAVEIRRRLAAEHPEIYLPNLATSLNNMANYLSDLGRYDESVEIAMEAIGIRRELVAMNPFGHSLDLATSLNDITVTFSRNGNDVEAVTFGEEAISIYRDLELLGRRGHEPYLAVALANNIATLANTGRIDEAAAAGAEAWERLEELLTTDSRLIIELARCTESLGGVLERLRRDDEAIAALERSIELFHSLSDRPNLTRKLPAKLSRLIDVLIRTGRADDALQRVDELTQIWATIVEDQPDLLPDFAGNLGDFAMRLALFKGFEAKALPLAEQVAVLSETLADQSPTEFLTLHAQALTAVSILLQRTDRLPEAIAVGDRALMIHRRIPEGDSVDHLETLARALGQQGSMCNRGGDVLRGLSLLEEGIEIFRRLSAENPNTLGELAGMLVGFASACGASGTRAGDAFSAVLEAIEIYRLLVEQNPAEYGGGFMEAHRLLLLLLESVGRHEDAAELRLMLGE
jgi:tetratricopeptide (TPR) repeat protein